jgi:hypothetical protein
MIRGDSLRTLPSRLNRTPGVCLCSCIESFGSTEEWCLDVAFYLLGGVEELYERVDGWYIRWKFLGRLNHICVELHVGLSS